MSKLINVKVEDALYNELVKRAKRELIETDELVEDIIRRSMLSYKKKTYSPESKIDDSLVSLFSRQRKGKAGKKKTKISTFYESQTIKK